MIFPSYWTILFCSGGSALSIWVSHIAQQALFDRDHADPISPWLESYHIPEFIRNPKGTAGSRDCLSGYAVSMQMV